MAFCLMLIATSAHARITPATEYEPKTEDIKSPGNPGTSLSCANFGYYEENQNSSSNNAVCSKMKIYTTGGSKECWICVCPEGYIYSRDAHGWTPLCTACIIKKNGATITSYKC